MMYSSYCTAIRDDETIAESKKAHLINEYNYAVRKTINAKLNPKQKTDAKLLRRINANQQKQLNLSKMGNDLIQKTRSDMKQSLENCLDANAAYTHKKLEDLNKSLAKLYSQGTGASDEDSKKWALETIEKSREFKKDMEILEEKRKQYNELLSKDITGKVYKLFHYIFETVDSKLMAVQQLNPKLKYETSDKLVWFNDEKMKAEPYTLRKVVLPKGSQILINCVPGELKQGIVLTCPSLEFVEIFEGRIIQFFTVKPFYGGGSFTVMSPGVQLEKERVLKDVSYRATGEKMLTEELKNQFNETFREFFNIAYSR